MRSRPTIWILLCLLCLAGAWLLWHQAGRRAAEGKNALPGIAAVRPASTARNFSAGNAVSTNAAKSGAVKTNEFAYRLSNTGKSVGQLARNGKAILLENALIDSGLPLNFSIPKNLQAQGDPGSYIVQSRGPVGPAFRALLASAGAQIVSYIPNNAYLVRIPAGGASALASNPLAQSVIPYEPYYKIQPSLIGLAVQQQPLPDGAVLTLGLFADNAPATVEQIEKLGGTILSRDSSPFGPVVRVQPPADWTALAMLPGVQIVEPYRGRIHANDLSRPALGVSLDSVTTTNYMGLSGLNVTVEVNDSGIDANHPDLLNRVFGFVTQPGATDDGHGTFIAGQIMGDGTKSTTVTNAQGSIMPGTNGQFRGKAPLAKLFSENYGGSDRQLQQAAVLTNALISNNSWNYGDNTYDLEAASYDAATRDAMPEVTGSQPVLFVFSAGNGGQLNLRNGDGGGGGDDGTGGNADSILSPATAKDVITVGAVEQMRNITNTYTPLDSSNQVAVWQPKTDTSFEVAGFSSRGNVGIGSEGDFGRYKPDVVAPGTFVISTRSAQWDELAYYSPTNYHDTIFKNQVVQGDSENFYPFFVPTNTVQVNINYTYVGGTPDNTNLMLYVWEGTDPNGAATSPPSPKTNNISIPPDSSLTGDLGVRWWCAVSNMSSTAILYTNLFIQVVTTNDYGNYLMVLSNMNNTLDGDIDSTKGNHYYRYESGTSMAAADVSGVLALMQDYFTNTLKMTPSPALMKAMLINGARTVWSSYDFEVTNSINYQGWGEPNLPDSLPPGITNQFNQPCSELFVDQSTNNALATGDSHTLFLTMTNADAQALPDGLRITLAWTDPPGDPAAAIKLVNDLNLVVTNFDDPANPVVYYGNDIQSGSTFNTAETTNTPPNFDSINNIENVYIPPLLGTNFSITVTGYRVNVNAVTAQTNNVVQDYALAVSSGDGEVTNAFTVSDNGIVSNPTADQDITFVASTNAPLFNQFVGANTPLLGATNTIPDGTNIIWGADGAILPGMTNQWHFYVVTNNALDSSGSSADVINAAFITFLPPTLSIPREGVLADSLADSTRPEADIDLYVTTDSSLLILSPLTISNCVNGVQVGSSSAGVFNGVSLGRGGTEFVVDTNSTPGQVYYIGVKSEDQMASEYAFMPVFTSTPFGRLAPNGDQIINGVPVPVDIPDGSPNHPGIQYVFGLALYPMDVHRVVVTNVITHQNFGDLAGSLTHGNGRAGTSGSIVLNNHDSTNAPGTFTFIYDDSGQGDIGGSINSDGPGSLQNFVGQEGFGLWYLTESDNALTQTGSIQNFSLLIEPHQDLLGNGLTVTVQPQAWYYDYIDVPPGYTNLTVFATNLQPPFSPPLQLYLNVTNQPDFSNYLAEADLTNGVLPGNFISYGPPLQPARYWVGIYNPDTIPHNAYLLATLGGLAVALPPVDYYSTNSPALQDDAVTPDSIFISNTQLISSVNVGIVVEHPRISDLTFTLVSPEGQRILLMENRGGETTNGAGSIYTYTNVLNSTATGGSAADTNYLAVSPAGESVPITYNFYTVPDEMTVYEGTNPADFNPGSYANPALPYDTGLTNNPSLPGGGAQNTQPVTITVNSQPGYTNITIIMNQFGNPDATGGDAWIYTAGAAITNYEYLMFTEDSNLATVPIKFAVPPFSIAETASNYTLCDFEQATNGNYLAPTNIYDAFGGWSMPTNKIVGTNSVLWTNNEVSVVTDPSDSLGDNVGTNFLALADGTITRLISTIPGRQYNVTFWYRGPGISGWWRGEGNATDSSQPEGGNNGSLIGRFDFPAGEVGQAFEFEDAGADYGFAGTNTYVQIPQSPSLDVGKGGGFTVEGWISPTNFSHQEPLVEWLAKVPVFTNSPDTNFSIVAGPFLNRATSHYYYLLAATNWTTSEIWATNLGGHLATIDTANEQNWVYDAFANFGGTNRNLWIGLTNSGTYSLGWISGVTNVFYTNWANAQPLNCDGNRNYTFILGSTNTPGLWTLAGNNGFTCANPLKTNQVFGVVEVDDIQTNGVQFWISATNTPGTTNAAFAGSNGCLYADVVDVSNVSHEIYSATGLIQSNIYQHVALTFSTNSGIAMLYLNGTNVATTNLFLTNGVFTPFVPKTGGDVLLGRDMSLDTNNYYGGMMDEMSIYGRALSGAEIAAIYRVSASATNGLAGKFDPSVTPAYGLAEAQVSFGAVTNIIMGVDNQWELDSYTFTAASNSMPLQISGLEPGILLDDFAVSEEPLTNLYYLPEQTLDELDGDNPYGTWTLQVWDNRTGAYVTDGTQLVSWELQFVLQSNVLANPLPVSPQYPSTITVPPGQTVFLSVAVPSWAASATNVLVSATAPVDLFFNPTNPPTGANPGDLTLLAASTGGTGTPTIAVNTPLPFTAASQAGQSYYLGVKNTGTHAVTAVVEVDFDITTLTNGVPFTGEMKTNDLVDYFDFNVSSNAYEATFQLLHLSSNADLVISKGPPLPTLTNSDYGSFNASNADENIYVLTNSSPVPLSAGLWYLGVFKRDPGPVDYTVLAKELDLSPATPNVIPLTNGVPVDFTAGPGAALTNFFSFLVTNTVTPALTNYISSIRFELYHLTGNGDLTVQTNALPLSPPFFQSSQNPGVTPELIFIQTNSALTNLAATWYLGVPNNETNLIHYTIIAEIDTNGVFPAFPGAQGAGAGAAGGGRLIRFLAGISNSVYHVISLDDSGPGTLRDAVSSTNRTVVFDISGTINLVSPLIITNSYLTIAGQTAPGGGVTVSGQMTTLTNVHDVIIRDMRFHPGGGIGASTNVVTTGGSGDSLQLNTVSNVIADHISALWSTNEDLSVLNSTNVTVQWSVISDSLNVTNMLHGYGALLRYGGGTLSFNHNLFADNAYASPRLGDNVKLDFVDNVIYDWGTNAGFSTNDILDDPTGFTNEMNYACNYLIASTNSMTNTIAFWGGTTNTWVFQTNNFIDSDTNGILNGANTGWNMFTTNITKFDRQFPLPPVPTDEAFLAYEKVLDFAGPDMGQRDWADTNIVGKVRSQTGQIISIRPTLGLVAWWKGESNTLDSIGTNNGIAQNITYTNGEVGQAFVFDGSSSSMRVPASSSLNVGLANGFTIETWINPTDVNNYHVISEWNTGTGSSDATTGAQFWIVNYNGPGTLYANLEDTTTAFHTIESAGGVITTNGFQHVAVTYDKTTGAAVLYRNGVVVATQNLGIFTPQTSFDLYAGYRPAGSSAPSYFQGGMDELSLYNRALSAGEIQKIYRVGRAGKFYTDVQPYLDTDQDGIPDFWENTFGTDPFSPNPNGVVDGSGYTELEEYINWLAAPHALTVTNTPVGVDLQQTFGQTGNLSFFVTNAVNGSVYLTNVWGSVTNTGAYSNSFAIFTPTNDFGGGTNYGYASFDAYVTNNDTVAYFGPVTVSVVVSKVLVSTNFNMPPNIITLTNGVFDPTITNGSDFYEFTVTNNAAGSNAVAVLFTVTNASGPVDLLANYGLPSPSLSSYEYISTNSWTTSENIIILPGSTPVALTNGDWYLAVVNVAGSNVTYDIKATELFTVQPPVFYFPTNTTATNILETVPYAMACVATDIDSPPLPLTYALVSAPTNMTLNPSSGVINWTPTEAQGPSTNSISVSVANASYSVTNIFSVIVDESNLPPFWPPNVPSQTNYVITALSTLTVTDTATDSDIPVNPLTYTLLNPPSGAAIGTNGVITWTPTLAQAGTNYLFTTVVTDTNQWAVNSKSLSATNHFTVSVLPDLVGGQPQTNTVPTSSIGWFAVSVPTNAIAATNILLYATNLPVNVWFSTNAPPTITNAGDVVLIPGATNNGMSVLTTNSAPTNIVAGGTYYLGVQNTNGVAVTYGIEVNFQLAVPAVTLTNAVSISGIAYASSGGTNGFLLTWLAPSNELFKVQWAASLAPASWGTFTNIVGYNTNVVVNPTNAQFNFLDNGSQTPPGLPPIRFYRLILLGSSPAVTSPVISSVFLNAAGLNLQWFGPTNDQFQVRWTTNLTPIINWTLFANIITSTNGTFLFTDTNAPLMMKFYELILLP